MLIKPPVAYLEVIWSPRHCHLNMYLVFLCDLVPTPVQGSLPPCHPGMA